jgi:glucose-fructose oxidoreductase
MPTPLRLFRLSRRQFLQQTAIGAGAAWVASARLRAEHLLPPRPLGVALVGLGGFAADTVLPELAVTPGVKLAGLVTGDPAGKGARWAREQQLPLDRVFHYEEMHRLREVPEIDFVHVLTPTGLHAEHTVRAAAAGKHVLCEKPLATSAADCDRMIAACRAAGVQLGVNYRLQWEPHHRHMMALAAEGGIRSLTTEFSWTRGDHKPWLLDRQLAGGGAFFDTGVYLVQAGSTITGQPVRRVTAFPTSHRDVYPPGIEETMSALFEYEGQVTMLARASYACGNHTFQVNTSRGVISCEGHGGGSAFGQSYRGSPSGKIVRGPSGVFKAPDTLQVAELYQAFAQALRSGQAFAASGEMGRRDVAVIEAVYRSAATGQTVEVDERQSAGGV